MILLVCAHPSGNSLTVSAANGMAERLEKAGIPVHLENLYDSKEFDAVLSQEELLRKTSFDPVVQHYMQLAEQANGYVIVHPDWWGGPPAILKGWVDRVLRPQTAYSIPEGFARQEPEPLWEGRKALIVIFSDGEDPEPLQTFWCDRVWGFCGVETRFSFFPLVRQSSGMSRRSFLDGCAETAARLFGQEHGDQRP